MWAGGIKECDRERSLPRKTNSRENLELADSESPEGEENNFSGIEVGVEKEGSLDLAWAVS